MKKRKKQYKNRPYYFAFWRKLNSQVNTLIFIMLWSMSSVSFANTVQYGISTYDLNKLHLYYQMFTIHSRNMRFIKLLFLL